MTVQVQFSETIDRPVETVFQFFAVEHVRNHPRWDPDMKLEQMTDGPIGIGTVIRRVNSRSGTPVEGTMEVVEFEPNQSIGAVVYDGPMEMRSRVTFEALGEDQTRMVTHVEFPGMDESTDTTPIVKGIERSARIRRQLIESET